MRVLIVVWIVCLTALSLAPWQLKVHLRTPGPFHNLGHFVMFFATALLLCWNTSGLSARIWRCLAALGLGMVLEELEAVVFRNPYEWTDVRVDALGITLAFSLLTTLTLLGPSADKKRVA